jgi:Coenzyme PQQ synthesis protein D (PqqD)
MPRNRSQTATVEVSQTQILDSYPSVPDHVVYREFVNETVVLNLQTGKYHGLNPSGGKMLEALGQADTVRAAAASLAEFYGRPTHQLEDDLCAFCRELSQRGLIELTGS